MAEHNSVYYQIKSKRIAERVWHVYIEPDLTWAWNSDEPMRPQALSMTQDDWMIYVRNSRRDKRILLEQRYTANPPHQDTQE